MLGLLGCGGFGAVELVEHSKDQSTYALKASGNIPTGGDPKSGCSKIDSKRARSDKFFLECLNIVDAC